jgi:hypothetical protein
MAVNLRSLSIAGHPRARRLSDTVTCLKNTLLSAREYWSARLLPRHELGCSFDRELD